MEAAVKAGVVPDVQVEAAPEEDGDETAAGAANGTPKKRSGHKGRKSLGRIFAMLNPKTLEKAFRDWVAAVTILTKGEVVAIDDKTLRRSFQKAGSNAFVHMVSAWATGNRMVLGQVKTEEKSNEITAIPRLLELLQLHGCLVTIDTMGCQMEIATKIVESKADYMLAVKDNQPTARSDYCRDVRRGASRSTLRRQPAPDRKQGTRTQRSSKMLDHQHRRRVRRALRPMDRPQRHCSRRNSAHARRKNFSRAAPLHHVATSLPRMPWPHPEAIGASRTNFTGFSMSASGKTTAGVGS